MTAMHPTKVELELVRRLPPDEPLHFRYTQAGIRNGRIFGAVLIGLAVIGVLAADRLLVALLVLPVGLAGLFILSRVQRRLAMRSEAVTVDDSGLTLEYGAGAATVLPWERIVTIRYRRRQDELVFGTRDGRSVLLDANLDDLATFLDAVTLHVDASRRVDSVTAPTRCVFRRSMTDHIGMVVAAALGLVLGLVARPALFVITVLALPRLVWRWLMEPHTVVVGENAVSIVRPLARDIIPLRAIRDVAFGLDPDGAGLVVVFDHFERGYIQLDGFNEDTLPIFEAVLAATQCRDGRRGTHLGAVGDSRVASLLYAAAVVVGLLATAWVTILTGVPLRTAVDRGNDLVARTALLMGAPPNAADEHGLTALHYAAAKGDAAMVRMLVHRGADVHARSRPNAYTPLHKAAEMRAVEGVAALIASGADLNALSTPGRTPLAHSLQFPAPGADEVARLLLDAGAEVDRADAAGRTPLHHAARRGHAGAIALLAARGARLEARDTTGETPLHLAVERMQEASTLALLDAGASVNARGWAGRTPLAAAAADTAISPHFLDLLLVAGARADLAGEDGWNAVQLAAIRDNVHALELFARVGVPLDASTDGVPPALWLAIRRNHVEAVRVLLRGRADPNRPWNGYTAHDYARRYGSPDIAALLRTRG